MLVRRESRSSTAAERGPSTSGGDATTRDNPSRSCGLTGLRWTVFPGLWLSEAPLGRNARLCFFTRTSGTWVLLPVAPISGESVGPVLLQGLGMWPLPLKGHRPRMAPSSEGHGRGGCHLWSGLVLGPLRASVPREALATVSASAQTRFGRAGVRPWKPGGELYWDWTLLHTVLFSIADN